MGSYRCVRLQLLYVLGAEELADQTEIEMPKESVEPVEDVYENANPQDYGIDYEPEDVHYGI